MIIEQPQTKSQPVTPPQQSQNQSMQIEESVPQNQVNTDNSTNAITTENTIQSE